MTGARRSEAPLNKNKMKKYIIGLLVAVAVLGFATTVGANAPYLQRIFMATLATPGTLYTATTTPIFMSAGTATTTVVLDSTFTKYDEASLLIQLTSSTTPTELRWQYQFSQDKKDWYDESIDNNINATTTNVSMTPVVHRWGFASSTDLRGGTAQIANTVARKLVTVPTPTQYTRVIFYLPIGVGNASLYTEAVPQKQLSY